ncbi:YkvA family protein [Desulfallas thermosapovorans]|uniref:Uncharacterized membrane protein YkvA (DUF1232 family) n=1 Tax=Desulfallas thermosapovorans DSM 6562 TaxID=1121431 RepID=A0A5S4ZR91_9FIRM|nr:YkvA family protein [Desulfallas thermosapovorans]TYO95344.1 uncharacterized membrane protein YkvA (DUF1232 family) [Desulfallas thermosapovorans DSM 6562]
MSKEMDFYQNLRVKIKKWLDSKSGADNKWAEYILLAPDIFHLLYKLTLDKDVYVADKAKLAAAIAYFISPVDLIPEALLGPAGYVDDLALAAYVLNRIINNTDPEVVRRNWAGDGDVLEVIQSILRVADKMVGSGLWKKLKARI